MCIQWTLQVEKFGQLVKTADPKGVISVTSATGPTLPSNLNQNQIRECEKQKTLWTKRLNSLRRMRAGFLANFSPQTPEGVHAEVRKSLEIFKGELMWLYVIATMTVTGCEREHLESNSESGRRKLRQPLDQSQSPGHQVQDPVELQRELLRSQRGEDFQLRVRDHFLNQRRSIKRFKVNACAASHLKFSSY